MFGKYISRMTRGLVEWQQQAGSYIFSPLLWCSGVYQPSLYGPQGTVFVNYINLQ